ncbi:MAG: DNA primase [Betaproteobacteria bacterium]|nr:DNA primase [Betaproteobacteria bacterium]
MIPESFLQELLSRTDLVGLIDAHVPLKKAGVEYAACCPFHNEKTPSFTVSPTKQFYHCFGCGAHGTAIGFLMEYTGLDFREAVRDLASRAGMQVPETLPDRNEPRAAPRNLVQTMGKAADWYYGQLRNAQEATEYLKRRGVSGETAKLFRIGYAPPDWQNLAAVFPDYQAPELLAAGLVTENENGRRYDRFRDRVIFPILNAKGETVAFGGRLLESAGREKPEGDQGPKYLNSPETPLFSKGQELFGLPQARAGLRETDTAIVVEGYMDVVMLAQHGVRNAVATLGTATTSTHVKKLFRQVSRVVFCFDGDAAGKRAAWRALENCLEAIGEQNLVAFAFLPEGHDPDSFVSAFGKDAFLQRIAEAVPLSDFLLRALASQCEMGSAEGHAKLLTLAKPLLARLSAPLLRLQIAKRLAEASGFSQQEVERVCDLRPVVPPPPPRAKRPAPSLLRTLIRDLLQCPELARRVPLESLPGDDPDSGLLRRLATLLLPEEGEGEADEIGSHAMLIERLRRRGEEELLRQLNSINQDLLRESFSREDIEAEFGTALEKLSELRSRREFEELKEKARKLGVSGLSSDEKARYLRLLARTG